MDRGLRDPGWAGCTGVKARTLKKRASREDRANYRRGRRFADHNERWVFWSTLYRLIHEGKAAAFVIQDP